jgi:hypothetical protein
MVTTTATDRGLHLLDELETPLRDLQTQQFALLSEEDLVSLIGGLERVRESIARGS